MKKHTLNIVVVGTLCLFAFSANAQMMGGSPNATVDWDAIVKHTQSEEAEGKALWEKFQAKEVSCADLADEQYGVLGEYFMGTMTGEAHASMNAMMMQMHGEEGEEQIHITMGKRLSGCDASATISGISGGWMPMMNMMGGGWSSSRGITNQSYNSMMGGDAVFGFGFGPFFMILWWVLIIAGIVALVKWISGAGASRDTHAGSKSALDMLKERYAKGEIDKSEFDERKKDLL